MYYAESLNHNLMNRFSSHIIGYASGVYTLRTLHAVTLYFKLGHMLSKAKQLHGTAVQEEVSNGEKVVGQVLRGGGYKLTNVQPVRRN